MAAVMIMSAVCFMELSSPRRRALLCRAPSSSEPVERAPDGAHACHLVSYNVTEYDNSVNLDLTSRRPRMFAAYGRQRLGGTRAAGDGACERFQCCDRPLLDRGLRDARELATTVHAHANLDDEVGRPRVICSSMWASATRWWLSKATCARALANQRLCCLRRRTRMLRVMTPGSSMSMRTWSRAGDSARLHAQVQSQWAADPVGTTAALRRHLPGQELERA
jgi:hypothetical protein